MSVIRPAAVASAVTVLLIVIGCTSSSHVEVVEKVSGDQVLVQSNRITLQPGLEQDVYYPVPYAFTPELVVEDDPYHQYVIVEQKPDHFKLRNRLAGVHLAGGNPYGVKWTAKGLKVSANPPPVVIAPPPAPPAPRQLPGEPVPIASQP